MRRKSESKLGYYSVPNDRHFRFELANDYSSKNHVLLHLRYTVVTLIITILMRFYCDILSSFRFVAFCPCLICGILSCGLLSGILNDRTTLQ